MPDPRPSTAPTTPDLGDATIFVRPWADPIVDELGHEPRSHYVERYWLGILGPSTTFLLRRIATELDRCPDGFSLHLAETARSLGLGARSGRNSPFLRSLDRLAQFGLARRHLDELDVRRRVPPLTRLHLSRLPQALQAEHQEWLDRSLATPTPHDRLRRARRLALGLLELGEDVESVEAQLHQWRFHPAMAYDAVRWARDRCTSEEEGPEAA